MAETTTESLLPVLSAGRHRNARRGACFMEYASYLAGQRWSDHPSCTHPSLAALARLVNDLTSDGNRGRLASHIPAVVGLNGDDPRIPLVVSALAASSALPVASQSRQRALAAGLVRCELLLQRMDGDVVSRALSRIRVAFALTPGTEDWARAFLGSSSIVSPQPLLVNDEAILRTAVIGIADACVMDRDARLERLLGAAIAECTAILSPARALSVRERSLLPA
jgi:hypothetical protein